MKGWTGELALDKLVAVRCLFFGDRSHGLSFGRAVDRETNEPVEVWRFGLARRKRSGFVRLAEQGAELGPDELRAIRDYCNEALGEVAS